MYVFAVVKRLPEHVQVDNPEVLKKLAKKLERQQVCYYMLIYHKIFWHESVLCLAQDSLTYQRVRVSTMSLFLKNRNTYYVLKNPHCVIGVLLVLAISHYHQ